MGILDAIQGNRVYLDTNIWIYSSEGYPAFIQDLTQLFQSIDQGDLSAVTSELTLAEVLVKPLQNQGLVQQATYKQFIRSSQQLSVGVRFELAAEGLEIYRPDGQKFATYVELDQQREQAIARVNQEVQRADRLAAKLQKLGIDPDTL